MFASFDFYKKEYHGVAIASASSYAYYGERAAEYIEQATFGRATDKMVAVKKCECRLAEILFSNHEDLNEEDREIKSETVGGWSRTYAENKLSPDALAARIHETISRFLGMKGLLYCGIGRRA